MAPRRSSTNPNSGNATPRPTRGSFRGMRSLSLVTDQTTSLATTAQTVETGTPWSEISPQVPPTMPPRPWPSPETSPHHSVRRQSIQPNTYEALDSSSQPQPPISMPMPTPSPQSPFRSPPTSIPPGEPAVEGPGGFVYPPNQPAVEGEGESISSPHQPAPGGGVGGFTYPRQYAADYPHPPNYGSADISRGIHEKVWHTYNKVSQEFDEKKLEKWNKDLEALLLFVSLKLGGGLCSEMTQNTQAALFSAIVTAFLITSLNDLGPNYQQQSALLLYQSLNGRDPNQASMSDPTAPFQPSSSAIAVNCLWSVSLSASLSASFIAVICKEWLVEYNSSTNIAVDLLQACWRQHHFLILHKLKINFIISLLPPLLHSSVIFFFAGAIVYFWQIDMRVAAIYLVAGGIFCTTYFISTFLPIIMKAQFRPSSAQLVHKSTVAIGKAIESIADAFAHGCFCALHTVTGAILRLLARTTIAEGALHTLHQQTRTISLGVSKHT